MAQMQTRVRGLTSSSNDSFVCNVSRDDVIERDIDLEIEARIRSATIAPSTPSPPPDPAAPSSPRLGRKMSLSQRMLQAARKNRLKRSAVHQPQSFADSRLVEPQRDPHPEHEHETPLAALPHCVDTLLEITRRPSKHASMSSLLLSTDSSGGAHFEKGRPSKHSSTSSLSLSTDGGTHVDKGRPSKQSTASSLSLTHSICSDLDGLLLIDPIPDATMEWPYLSDDDDELDERNPMQSSTCSDRMQARISNKKDADHARDQRERALSHNDSVSSFTGRRTYPAEPAKKIEARNSERAIDEPKRKTKMDRALEQQHVRAMEARHGRLQTKHSQQHQPERTPSTTSDSECGSKRTRAPVVAMTTPRAMSPCASHSHSHSHHTSLSHSHSGRSSSTSSNAADANASLGMPPSEEQHKMASSVREIEAVVQGLEQCLTTVSFLPLAKDMLRELDMLHHSLTTIRRRGTSLIFDEMQCAHYESAEALRVIVAHAVQTQMRVEALSTFVRVGPGLK